MSNNLKPIMNMLIFIVFWLVYFLTYTWYFQTTKCAYYSDFWLAYGHSIESPWWGFFITGCLFLIHSLITLFSFRKHSKVTIVISLLLCITSFTYLFGMYEFKRFMLFQNSHADTSKFLDIDSLNSGQKRRLEFTKNNYELDREQIVNEKNYCAATNFYKK